MLQFIKTTEEGMIEGALVSINGCWRMISIERRAGFDNILVQSYDMKLSDLLNLLQDQGWEVIQ